MEMGMLSYEEFAQYSAWHVLAGYLDSGLKGRVDTGCPHRLHALILPILSGPLNQGQLKTF